MTAPDVACALVDAAFDAVAAVDVASLGDDELHVFVVRLHSFTSRLASLRSGPTGEWDARGVWADDGSKAPWARLGRECALGSATAKRELGRAKKLRCMPVTAAAFAAGKLSIDQVELLCSAYQQPIADVFDRDETVLVNELAGLRVAEGQRFVDYWIEGAFTEVDKERSRPDPAGRRLHAARTWDGHIDVKGWLDPVAGTEYLTELEAIERELYEADMRAFRDAADPRLIRTRAHRFADAQVEMARRSRAFRQGAYRKPDPLITVHVGLGTLTRMCELADGTVVSPGQVFPLLTHADVERVVFDSPSRVIDVGVRQRFFTGALRRAIEVRDRHCQHPADCHVPAEDCEIDHKTPYDQGGLTTQDNGQCLCRAHNLDHQNHPEHFDDDHDVCDDDGEPDQRPPPDAD